MPVLDPTATCGSARFHLFGGGRTSSPVGEVANDVPKDHPTISMVQSTQHRLARSASINILVVTAGHYAPKRLRAQQWQVRMRRPESGYLQVPLALRTRGWIRHCSPFAATSQTRPNGGKVRQILL